MKSDTVYYLYSPILFVEDIFINPIESIKENDSIKLFSILINNYLEIINSFESEASVFILFKNKVGFIFNELSRYNFINLNDTNNSLSSIIKSKIGEKWEKHIIINTDSIGLTKEKLNFIKNLLNHEDNCLVAGTSIKDKILTIAVNKFEMIDSFIKYFNYNDINNLLLNEKENKYLFYTINNILQVNSKEEFRILYHILSLKENFNFCSQKIHEDLTNLFIEYKEILK